MVFVIGNPVWIERRWSILRAALFGVCAALGGSVVALTLALAAGPLGQSRQWVFVVGSVGLAVATRIHLRLPQVRWQVPQRLMYRTFLAPPLYGFLLGLGVVTYIPSNWFYVLLLADIAQPVRESMLTGAVFGYGLLAAALIFSLRTYKLEPLRQVSAIYERVAVARRVWNVAALCGVAAVCIGMTWGG